SIVCVLSLSSCVLLHVYCSRAHRDLHSFPTRRSSDLEAIPPFAVGIFIVGFLVFTMGREETMDASQYVQTWSDSVIWLFLGGFFLAEGLKKTRLDYKLLSFALPKFGSRAQNVMLGLMLTTAVMSMLMSNTATTAMMLATVSPLLTQLGKNAPLTKVLLIGIPSAAAIGG